MIQISDLKGTKWKITQIVAEDDLPPLIGVTWKSNNIIFDYQMVEQESSTIRVFWLCPPYGTPSYPIGQLQDGNLLWLDQTYRTIEFIDGNTTNRILINWLLENAELLTPLPQIYQFYI